MDKPDGKGMGPEDRTPKKKPGRQPPLAFHWFGRVLQRLRGGDHGFGGDVQFGVDLGRRGAETEAVDADNLAVETDILAPEPGDPGLDRDALAARGRKNGFAIFLGLCIEAKE